MSKTELALDVTIKAADLAKPVAALARVAGRATPIEVCRFTAIEAVDGQLQLHATDLNVRLALSCAANVHKPGRALVPATRLDALLGSIASGDEVRLRANGKAVAVITGNYSADLVAPPAADYPWPQEQPKGTRLAVKPTSFRELIRQVSKAIPAHFDSKTPQAAQLTSVDGRVTLAGTDGYRVAVASYAGAAAALEGDVLLSKLFLSDAAGFLEGAAEAELVADEDRVALVAGDRQLIGRGVDAKFPTYTRVIPKNPDATYTLNRDALDAALQRVLMVVDPAGVTKARLIDLRFEGQSLTVTGRSIAAGEAFERLAISADGPDAQVTFNSAFLRDFLAAAAPGDISLAWQKSSMAWACTSLGKADTAFASYIAPVAR